MRKFAQIYSALCGAVLAVVIGYLSWLEYGLWSIAVDAAILLALPVCSLLHELGHMLFGAICKIKAVPEFKLFGSSGCKIIPKTDKKLRVRVFFTAIGGLLVNLLFIALGSVAMDGDIIPVWLAAFMPASAYLFFLNVVPVELSGGKTDGLIANDMLNNTDEGKVTLAVLKAQAQILGGKPVSELDETELFYLPQIREDDPAFISLTELRYEYLAAKGDDRAEKYRQRFEELKNEYL